MYCTKMKMYHHMQCTTDAMYSTKMKMFYHTTTTAKADLW